MTERANILVKKFHEAGLEPKIISLAKKVAKLGHYEESLGLLDNLLQVGTNNGPEIAKLAIEIQKEKELKEKEKK